jgi:hypothetical protein
MLDEFESDEIDTGGTTIFARRAGSGRKSKEVENET